MRRSFGAKLMTLTLAASLLLSACGGATNTTPAVGGAAGATSTEAAAPKELKKLKVGYLNVMDDAQAMLAKDGGFYEQYGLDVELILFGSGTDLIKGIVAGQLDAGVLGFTNAVSWVDKGADLKVVGGAQMGYHSILVPKGSDIKTVADLKGKSLASQRQGSTADIVLNGVVFEQAGLKRDDLNMVYVEPSVAIQALGAGQVDAAFVFEPFEAIARATTDVEAIYEIGRVWPFPCMVVITSGDMLKKDRDAIHAVLDAQKDAMLMMQEQPYESAKLITHRFVDGDTVTGPKGTRDAVEVIEEAIRSQMFHWDISELDIQRMEDIIEMMHADGLIENKMPVDSLLDLTWQNSAPKSAHKH